MLAAAGLTVLDPDTGPGAPNAGSGVRLRQVACFADRLFVVPFVGRLEEHPVSHDERHDENIRIRKAASHALTAAGWEACGQNLTGVEFIAHTPAVRMARAVLSAAGIPLLAKDAHSGAGVFVHPVDGDQQQVRIVAWTMGLKHKPYPDSHPRESAEAWVALMHQVLDAMALAGWAHTSGVIHDCAQFRVPDQTAVPVRPMPVLGCDPEADDFVQRVARVLREGGYMPLAAFHGLAGPAWGFQVSAPTLASGHVRVVYSHRRPAPVSAPYMLEERAKVRAMLTVYRQLLSADGMTFADAEDHTDLWVNRPERSTRARIVLAEESGFQWLPELADTYQFQIRESPDEPWQTQGTVPQAHMLRIVEHGLRRAEGSAESEAGVIYFTRTTPGEGEAPYSRYLPVNEA
ncbi:hypothetical protein EEJ42_08240 [Streptomyces botrytidirepellens]|uniref:Uncharacterized protein n=1 Tax=Streptomyces botrytidirepellens TaxID=2486417 RepID=A0A3M8WTT0_9ACTN|nr:hypothetical protein EEJ42_08240 [Streptomyces botrytidirepellens]